MFMKIVIRLAVGETPTDNGAYKKRKKKKGKQKGHKTTRYRDFNSNLLFSWRPSLSKRTVGFWPFLKDSSLS